jgi:hypothetical protein
LLDVFHAHARSVMSRAVSMQGPSPMPGWTGAQRAITAANKRAEVTHGVVLLHRSNMRVRLFNPNTQLYQHQSLVTLYPVMLPASRCRAELIMSLRRADQHTVR